MINITDLFILCKSGPLKNRPRIEYLLFAQRCLFRSFVCLLKRPKQHVGLQHAGMTICVTSWLGDLSQKTHS